MIDDPVLRELLTEIQHLGPSSPSRRYPGELKARIVKWAAARRHAGAATNEVEQAIGIPWASLGRWLQETGTSPAAPTVTSLRPVRVVKSAAAAPSTWVLRTPRGFTVEGLDLTTLATLLERLG